MAEDRERQHPCHGCGGLTDESELQVTEVMGDNDWYCQECINAGVPEKDAEADDEDHGEEWKS